MFHIFDGFFVACVLFRWDLSECRERTWEEGGIVEGEKLRGREREKREKDDRKRSERKGNERERVKWNWF